MSVRHLLDRRAARSTRSLSGTIFRGLLLFVVGVTAAFALVLAGLYYLSPERAPEDQMVAFLGSLMAPVAVALLAAALLALLLSRLITRRIMRPLCWSASTRSSAPCARRTASWRAPRACAAISRPTSRTR